MFHYSPTPRIARRLGGPLAFGPLVLSVRMIGINGEEEEIGEGFLGATTYSLHESFTEVGALRRFRNCFYQHVH